MTGTSTHVLFVPVCEGERVIFFFCSSIIVSLFPCFGVFFHISCVSHIAQRQYSILGLVSSPLTALYKPQALCGGGLGE